MGRGMAAVSAGCVVTRLVGEDVEVLLVHPRGATFQKPLFGIPKGLVEPGEQPQQTAEREVLEETGLRVVIDADLGTIRQKSGKLVHAFRATVAAESAVVIDAFGRCRSHDSENDVCRFYSLAKAVELMIPAQRELLVRLRSLMLARRNRG
jgi:predicted NUDIX family NTP pyrophosphohydrolase